MCSALVGASLLALDPTTAQSLSDSEKIERLQRQTEQLQKQLKALQEEIALTKKKTEKVEAAQAKEAAPAGHAAPTPDRDPTKSPIAKAPAWTDKVKVTLGGFVTADTVFRARNQVNDTGTSFTAIPYPFSPLYGEHEFHGSARQSRLSVLAEGNIDPKQKLAAYWESDFMGVATNSNYTETNSWALRVRNAYLTYDNTAWGFHLLAGQSWSLLTQNTVGITPRKENIPLTIDADYVDGFNYTRGWQIRLVQDFGQKVWLGVSVETPATIDNNVPAARLPSMAWKSTRSIPARADSCRAWPSRRTTCRTSSKKLRSIPAGDTTNCSGSSGGFPTIPSVSSRRRRGAPSERPA